MNPALLLLLLQQLLLLLHDELSRVDASLLNERTVHHLPPVNLRAPYSRLRSQKQLRRTQ